MKKQIESLIEKLADKTLSFGCEVLFKNKIYRYLGKRDNELIFKDVQLRDNTEHFEIYFQPKDFKILGHPLMIGDILEETFSLTKDENVILLWRACGIKKSLQQIINDSGWEYYQGDQEPLIQQRLKDKNARVLLNFLKNLIKL